MVVVVAVVVAMEVVAVVAVVARLLVVAVVAVLGSRRGRRGGSVTVWKSQVAQGFRVLPSLRHVLRIAPEDRVWAVALESTD